MIDDVVIISHATFVLTTKVQFFAKKVTIFAKKSEEILTRL